MIDADDFSLGADEVGEHVREVAASGADVQDAGGGVQEGEEGFGGRGVHVGGGDGGAVADGLGGVFVGGGGGVVGAIDLFFLLVLRPSLDFFFPPFFCMGSLRKGAGFAAAIAAGADGGFRADLPLALLVRPGRI